MADEHWRLPYTAAQLQGAATNQVPRIGASGNWEVWDISTSAWVDTGVAADPQTAKIDADDIAPVETASTASQAYAANEFLVYSGQLYRVTAAIEQGDTLTVGTNIAAADVATYLAMVAAAPNASGFAPTGYGLGANQTGIGVSDDLNDVTANGWYSLLSSTKPLNAPTWNVGFCSLFVARYNDNRVTQILYSSDGSVYKRTKHGPNTWLPWEYVNPPLVVDTEYRTTERFLGKPVYTKVVSFNGSSSAGTSTTDVAHNITNLDHPISIAAHYYLNGNNCTTLPQVSNVAGTITNNAIAMFNNTYVRFVSNLGDISTRTIYAVLKYTKTTD